MFIAPLVQLIYLYTKIGRIKKVMRVKQAESLLLPWLQLAHLGHGEDCLPQHIVHPWGQLHPAPTNDAPACNCLRFLAYFGVYFATFATIKKDFPKT